MSHGRADEIAGDTASELAAAAFTLARRFAAGGTLWCWAPGAPQHAQHVAVEFVHPVIMGTRALPAVALTGADALDTLRPLASAGDVLLVLAPAAPSVASALRRAEAWGCSTLWMGNGPPPSQRTADHLVWLSEDPLAASDGRLVLGYHLLWELTHVCFEHPGLLAVDAEETPTCTTCSDEGRLAEVVTTDTLDDATVRTATGTERVSTALVGPVHTGDLVLVHAGTAITVVERDG